MSPLARELAAPDSYRNAYGPFLPRPPQDFTQGAFGPFSPILPVPVDAPEDNGRAEPRREQYEVGWNLPVGQPGTEGIKLASFQTLRTIADLYSVARSCIQLRKNEIKGVAWDIVPTLDAAKAMRGSPSQSKDFGKRRAEALKFFQRPDPDYFTWSSWIGDVMEQVLVFDALSVFLQPKRGKGLGKGLLGSDLDCLQLIDGETIRPLYDLHGATPRPPAVAWQQYLYGVPRADFTAVITGRDIDEAGLTGAQWGQFRGDQLLYLPVEKRRWTPYGFPPVERALLPIMAGLQKQGYALDFFREGTVPAVYISPGDTAMTPNQIRELQDALNAITGDPAWHHKVIVLPPGSKTMPQRPAELADQFDEVVMNWVCMSFDVQPMELGISPKVSTTQSPGAANQMAKASQSSQERKATKPTLEFLSAICDYILQEVCRQADMRFLFEGLEEDEDELTQTTMLTAQISAGLRSIDEGRGELGLQPWGLPETSDPGWASPTAGFVPLGQVDATGAPVAGAQPDASHPAGAPPAGQAPGQPAGQRQPGSAPAGRQDQEPGQVPGRQQGNAGQSPGHDAAEAAAAAQQSAAGHGTGSSRASSPKAAHAELDALARHLRKGRAISTWQPRHLPAVTLAMISEDLAKGLSAGQAVDVARAITLPKADWEWAGKDAGDSGPKGWPGWELDEILARVYAGKLTAAFKTAARAIRQAAARWLGQAAGSADAAARAIRQAVEDSLGGILRDAWTEGYALGQQAAMAMITEADAVDWGEWTPGDAEAAAKVADASGLSDLLSQYGIGAIKSISGTNMDGVAQLLSDALDGGLSSASLARQILGLLNLPGRAQMIAQTEIARAVSAATLDRFSAMNVTAKQWLIAPSKACPSCVANASQGAIPANADFRSGVKSPPGHPSCRCAIAPAAVAGVSLAGKSVRVIDLNGQETRRGQRQDDDGGYAAGGGAAGVRPHDGDGRQQDIPGGVPGSTAGGEPPRWDGSEPEPRVMTVPDDEDDADYPDTRGVPSRPGTYWPAPYMDGYWPQGGHGTRQAGTSSPGGGGARGRPPNGVGKGAADLDDPNPADAEHVRALMEQKFPEKALSWVDDARWIGPVNVPLDRIDFSGEDSWAASHDKATVKRYAKDIKHGTGHAHPVILVQSPASPKAVIIDGHHRTLAYRKLGRPVKAYVGQVDKVTPEIAETHSYQAGGGGDMTGKAAVPGLTSRSGMISLDLPPGTIAPVPGGVDDHHVTVVYLGPDVDDDAFADACARAQAAARLAPGPLAGILAGAGSFEPSGSSGGKVPAFIPARIPGAERLRNDLADLSASEHADWKPHVTIAYLDPGEPLPDPGPPVPVMFTHLSVHRGGDVRRFPLGG